MKINYRLDLTTKNSQTSLFPQSVIDLGFKEANEIEDFTLKTSVIGVELVPSQLKTLNISECFALENIKIILIKSEKKVSIDLKRGEASILTTHSNFIFSNVEEVTAFTYDMNNLLTLNLLAYEDSKVNVYLIGK